MQNASHLHPCRPLPSRQSHKAGWKWKLKGFHRTSRPRSEWLFDRVMSFPWGRLHTFRWAYQWSNDYHQLLQGGLPKHQSSCLGALLTQFWWQSHCLVVLLCNRRFSLPLRSSIAGVCSCCNQTWESGFLSFSRWVTWCCWCHLAW